MDLSDLLGILGIYCGFTVVLQGKTSKTSKIRETHERNGDLANHLFGDKWECGYNMIQHDTTIH